MPPYNAGSHMPDPLPILLMTRPEPESRKFIADLRARGTGGFRPVISPLIGIRYTNQLPDLSDHAAVILTSRHSVAALLAGGADCSGPAFTVGKATAAAARAAGFDVQTADGDAEDLFDLIAQSDVRGPLLHLRGTHSRGNLASRLTQTGIMTREAVIYDQPELPLSSEAKHALDGKLPVVAPVFSPRTAALLATHLGQAPLSVAAMSESVAKAMSSRHINAVRIAVRPDAEAMLSVTIDMLGLHGCL